MGKFLGTLVGVVSEVNAVHVPLINYKLRYE